MCIRDSDRAVYERLKGCYVLTADKLAAARADMPVLHPLPRVDEIALEVDSDPRAAYFEQAQNGVYARMALMMTLLGLAPVQLGEGAPLLPEGTERNILRDVYKRQGQHDAVYHGISAHQDAPRLGHGRHDHRRRAVPQHVQHGVELRPDRSAQGRVDAF